MITDSDSLKRIRTKEKMKKNSKKNYLVFGDVSLYNLLLYSVELPAK